ncbi:MAG: hypothetical protein VZQ83_00320 [Eubacterium sp.]|nr:hypothetical protein [Eubacterium sp.]
MGSASLAIGICVGLALVVCFMKFMNRDKQIKTEYDERQKVVRGKSYMFAFYGVVFSNCIMLIISVDNMEIIRVLGVNVFFIPILIGIIVQFSHSIFNDGYVGLNNNMGRFMIGMSLISVFNIAVGIIPWIRGGFIQDGSVYTSFINLEVGAMFIILCVEMAIKKCIDKKQESAENEN